MGKQRTIGVIGAGGWLGHAFSQAIVNAGVAPEDSLSLSYRSARPDILHRAYWTKDNQELFDRSDAIIVSVRPEDFSTIQAAARGKLIISVMAGITVAQLSERFQTDRVARTLPNGAAEVGQSYTPWIASKGITDLDRLLVREILESCGSADEVTRESDIDYFTGLTGSGPAFPALLVSAMMKDAVDRGIDPVIARKSMITLLIGTGRMLENKPQCPEDIVTTFLGYRGTTAAAIETMRSAGFDRAVSDGLGAALRKSVTMGQAATENA